MRLKLSIVAVFFSFVSVASLAAESPLAAKLCVKSETVEDDSPKRCDFCDYLERNVLQLVFKDDARHPEYGVLMPNYPLPESLQAGLQERRANSIDFCLSCVDDDCRFLEDLDRHKLHYCIETYAHPTKIRSDVIVPNASYYRREFTVGFGIGKRARPSKVELLNVDGGRVQRREAKEFMKGVLSGFVFQPLIIEGKRQSIMGLYLTIDWN